MLVLEEDYFYQKLVRLGKNIKLKPIKINFGLHFKKKKFKLFPFFFKIMFHKSKLIRKFLINIKYAN